MTKSISEKLKEVLSSVVVDSTKIQSLDESSDFISELNMSSIDSLQLLSLVETEFNIYIEDDELNSDLVTNLGNLCAFIQRKMAVQE